MKEVAALTVLWIAGSIATLRFYLPMPGLRPDDIFKDIAHLFVGGLFGAYFYGMYESGKWWEDAPTSQVFVGTLAVALTLTEIVAFGLSVLK